MFLFLENINEIPLSDLFFPLGISIIFLVIPWIILLKFIGNEKSSLITTLFIIIFIAFSFSRGFLAFHENVEIQQLASNFVLMPIFGSIFIISLIYIWRKELPSMLNQTFNLMSILIVAFFIFQIGFDLFEENSFQHAQKLLDVPIYQINEDVERPNVYLILLDAYSGNTLLEKDFGFDNSEFYKKLRDRGFVVQEKSFSNYPNTELSMPSILNMNYLDFLVEIQGEDSNDMSVTQKLWNENKVMEFFELNGYQIYAFEGRGGAKSEMVSTKLCTLPFQINRELISELITNYLPISSIRENIRTELHFTTVSCVLETIENFESEKTPFYMHMHVRLPHQPFVFDKEGNKVSDSKSMMKRFDERLKDAYLQQLIFTNSKTIDIIDSIQKKDSSTVIIVMSDHAGRFGVDWDQPSELDYLRGFNTLMAINFPGKENQIPEQISTVNIFRIFFNVYFDTEYDLLDDRQIWYSPEKPFLQTDVTDFIKFYQIEK